MGESDRWRVNPDKELRLAQIDPGATPGVPGDRVAIEAAQPGLHAELSELQARLWAEARRALLVVLQGLDAAGKDGTIKHVFLGVNPLATRAVAFKEPTPEEATHDFLWRVHAHCPAAGQIGIFNRSHYEDIVAVRVRRLAEPEVWKQRYGLINAFESILAHGGTTTIKIYLHISPEEQLRRLDERRDIPDKRWKLRPSDWDDRQHWDEFQAAYQDALRLTSTPTAPWYVVPSNHKWYRNWAVSRILIDTLTRMDPRYPR